MRPGDVVNGYRILRPLTTAGGGQGMWTFAERAGVEYFLKQFLAPTYPTPDSPGSAALKQRKMAQCIEFEAHHRRLKEALSALVSDGGNLIVTKAFFRHGAKYYKVTEKVDTAGLDPNAIALLPLEGRLLILKTVAHSLRILHRQGIVHGDLKPGNILIKQTATGAFAAKLIDFDNSYFQGEPPSVRDELVGDLVYYSPELAAYIREDISSKASDLTTKSDVFALGLVYSEYLSGKLPAWDTGVHQYPWLAVAEGTSLSLHSSTLPEHLPPLIARMLSLSPDDRPTIEEVFTTLQAKGPSRDMSGTPVDSAAGALRGSLVSKRVVPAAPPEDDSSAPSKLKGSLMRRRGG